MNRILITGASGYIGRPLFARLRKAGLDVFGTRFQSECDADNSRIRPIDLRDESQVGALMDEISPDVVFHFAGLRSPAINDRDPEMARRLHVDVTRHLLARLNDSAHFVFLSTDKVFDGSHPCPDETAPVCPTALYGKLKLECERMIQNQTDRHHILRVASVHSIGEPASDSFIDRVIMDLKVEKTVRAFNNVHRCFVKLSELLDTLDALVGESRFGLYHAASAMMSYYDRARMICGELRVDASKLVPSSGAASPQSQNLNADKIRSAMGRVFS